VALRHTEANFHSFFAKVFIEEAAADVLACERRFSAGTETQSAAASLSFESLLGIDDDGTGLKSARQHQDLFRSNSTHVVEEADVLKKPPKSDLGLKKLLTVANPNTEPKVIRK